MVQAATLSWSAANIYVPGTTTQSTGYLAYLFVSAQSGDFGATAASVDTITSLIESKADLTEYIAATGATSGGRLSGATGYYKNFGAGDSLTAFAVVFDAATYAEAQHYIVTDEKTASWTSATGAKTVTFGSQANQTWTSVPEPGTAALALLGVGMLIRRRRA